MTPTIAIIGALEKEVRQIYTAVEKGTVVDEAGLHIVGGEYHGFTVVATTAGMGTVNAAAAAQHLISAYHANAIIFSGIAGGLNPQLHIGDVVIGEHLRYLDTDTASSPNPLPNSRNLPAPISSSTSPKKRYAPTATSTPPSLAMRPPAPRPLPPREPMPMPRCSVATTQAPSRSSTCAAPSPRATAS